MSGIDFSGVYDTIMQRAYAAAETKVNALANSIQSHFTTMQINDLGMQKDAWRMKFLNSVDIHSEKMSDTGYKIVLEMPDGVDEETKEIISSYFYDSKRYVLG